MKIIEWLTSRLAGLGAIFVAAMMLLTIADILMKNIFHQPVRGTFELVELSLVFAVFCGLPEIFRRDANIVVDVFDHLLRSGSVSALKLFGAAVTLAFLLLLGWAVIAPALDTIAYPQFTQEAGVPLTTFWVPIILGIGLTIVCTALAGVREIRRRTAKDPV